MAPGAEQVEQVVMPSKTYSAMMAGQAVLAIAPGESDLVDLIKTAGCGWCVEPGDVDGLAVAVEAIRSDTEGLPGKARECLPLCTSALRAGCPGGGMAGYLGSGVMAPCGGS